MNTKYYTINDDTSTFIVLQRRGFCLCYCLQCNTLFEIENIFYDHIYKCSNCNNASIIEKDNKHHKLYLELIQHEDINKAVKVISKIYSYRLRNADELTGPNPDKIGVYVDVEEKFINFSAPSLVNNSEIWKIVGTYTQEIDPVRFLHLLFRTVGIPTTSIGFNYYKIYEIISDFFYGEVLPVRELVSQLVYDEFPIFNLSKDFFDAMEFPANRALFRSADIKNMEDLCNYLNLPYKPNVVRTLTSIPVKDIDFISVRTFCKIIDNLDLKVELLSFILKQKAPLSYNESINWTNPACVSHLEFLFKDCKKELTERQILNFIKSMHNFGENFDVFIMYQNIKNSETFKDIKILYENRKGLTFEKLHDKLSQYSAILRLKEKNQPFVIDHLLDYEARMDTLSFKLPKKPSHLIEWSEILHNCISSYSDRFRSGESVLIGIYRKKKLLYNMEIQNNEVKQLKGKNNSNDIKPNHLKAIKKYLAKRKIDFSKSKCWR